MGMMDSIDPRRNTKKLNEVTVEFDKKLSSCCNRMTRAWEDREKMMNGIVARIVHFQVCPAVVVFFPSPSSDTCVGWLAAYL